VLVRQEEGADVPAVASVVTAAFADEGEIARLVEALRPLISEGSGVSLVAEVGGEVIGHVMFTPGLLDAPRRLVEVAVLSPLAVAPPHQRNGVGSALVTAGVARMAEQGAPVVFLEGSPTYYTRFGFTAGGELGFRKPSLRIPDAGFQALRLAAFEPWMTGTLVYAHAFWEADAVGRRDPDASA
jgi:putative acetyltransferase